MFAIRMTELKALDLSLTTPLMLGLLFVAILTLFNWTLEAIKWSGLIDLIHPLNRNEVKASILLGLSANIIAPNRTGDLAARLKYIPSHKRWRALYLNFFSATSQLFVTLLAGLLGILLFATEFYPITGGQYGLMSAAVFAISLLAAALYFRSNLLAKIYARLNPKLDEAQLLDVRINSKKRADVLLLSMGRYVIFCLQFLVLLYSFGAEISAIGAVSSLAILFFVQSFIPTNWITDLITKGSVIYFLFDWLSANPLIGMAAIIGLWVFNIFIPSLLGLIYLKDVNWLRMLKF